VSSISPFVVKVGPCVQQPIVNINNHTDVHPLLRYKFQTASGVHEDKDATLTDADNVWTEVRHMHMREAIDKLMNDFNKFLEENAGFKGYVTTAII
jgi:hypothetical protein